MIRTYSQLKSLTTFEDRFEYLSLKGSVGMETFGHERYMNQQFYRSKEWRDLRHVVIARDEGCDLGIPGYEIFDRPIVHHMNPMAPEHIAHGDSDILNPEYLILVTHQTHNAIHYGDASRLATTLVERQPGDTRLW
ncbi:HNH endonuclease [Arthrobacter phage Giantsbane]|nr:HNH endonuclease [Arthrobacter phage Giantsbane]